jgi:hypothetical protein
MWQDRLLHCVVFTKTSEEFAPHYLAGIRHDMRQTTARSGLQVSLLISVSVYDCGVERLKCAQMQAKRVGQGLENTF